MCSQSGEWTVTGDSCLGMCVPEVRYGGEERNTATLYQSYSEILVTTQLVGKLFKSCDSSQRSNFANPKSSHFV